MGKADPVREPGREQRQCRQKAQDACRLRPLNEVNQADDRIPARQHRHQDHVRVFRLRHLNAAEVEANPGCDRQNLVREVGQTGQRKALRRLASKVRRRSLIMVARQRESWARLQLQSSVGPDMRSRPPKTSWPNTQIFWFSLEMRR